MKIFFLAIGFVLLFAGCSSTKITSTPYAGYRMHEQLVIMPVAGLGELENDRLLQWSDAVLGRDLIFLKTIPYQDAYYQSKQHGLTLPEFNRYDTAAFNAMLNTLKLNYILTGEVMSITPSSTDPASPHYKQPHAVLSFQLIDTRHRTIAWNCTVRFTANPIGFGKDPASKVNVRNEDSAVALAYKKAIKRFTKNFELIPNRPQ